MTPTSISLLSSLFISAALFAQPCATPPKNMTASFSFDEPLFAKASRVPGIVGNALHFNGNASFFEIPATTPGLNAGEENFTAEAWIRTTTKQVMRNIVDKRDAIPKGWLLYIRRGFAGFQVVYGAELTDAISTNYRIDDGKWHHVVGVARRLPQQSPQIYVDGQLRAKNGRNITLANINNNAPLWLARHHANAYINRDDVYFDGDVDELAFYRRALEPAEIAALYKAGRAGKCRK